MGRTRWSKPEMLLSALSWIPTTHKTPQGLVQGFSSSEYNFSNCSFLRVIVFEKSRAELSFTPAEVGQPNSLNFYQRLNNSSTPRFGKFSHTRNSFLNVGRRK